MANLENTINQAISDFDSIQSAIEDMGVDVPVGTDTREYGRLIREHHAEMQKELTEEYSKGELNQASLCLGGLQEGVYAVPEGVTTLKLYSFAYCTNLTELVLPDSVTTIGNFLCTNATKLEKINIPSNVTTWSYNSLFARCSALHTIIFNKVTESMILNAGTTTGCSNLTNIIIEDGVIAQSWTFTDTPLSPESMIGIITHLKDFNGTIEAFTRTIKFPEACWEALEAYSTSPDGGTWADYVDKFAWNI